MSKKHPNSDYQGQPQTAGLSHQAEYRIIKHDLIKVVVLNVLYLTVILALYFSNQKSHFLDDWFSKILHF